MKAVLSTLDFAKERLGVLQVQVGQHQASYAMGRPEPTFADPMSMTGACRRPSRVLVCIVDETTSPRTFLSMTSLALVVASRHHAPPDS